MKNVVSVPWGSLGTLGELKAKTARKWRIYTRIYHPAPNSTKQLFPILNLEPNTTYYFTVESGQTRGTKAENEAETPNIYSFTTVAPGQSKRNVTPQVAEAGAAAGNLENGKVQITNGPVIEGAGGNSATIAWRTNIPGSTRVIYGTDLNNIKQYGPISGSTVGSGWTQKNLKPNTTCFFQVETGQAAGSEVESHVYTLKTPAGGGQLGRIDHPQQVR